MNIYMLDGQNVPEPTIPQKYQKFITNGGKSIDFAVQTSPIGQVDKIIVMRAFFKGGVMAFLSKEINLSKSFITTPELSDDDIEQLKIKTVKDMEIALRDIQTTRDVLTGKKVPDQSWEDNPNGGYKELLVITNQYS